ncbi:probable transcription factor GLK1 [Miscanthus floridulus]|uniref:probable transcription factor GLK1 n=1 Tax=Miscanthus floridulus TaxID=154761 RepID=UPI00345B35BB
MQHFGRPLHVWGHPTPTVESPRVPMWPRHLVPRTPPPPWAPPPPPSHPAFWHHAYMRGPAHMPGQVTPCVAVPMPAARFPAPPVRGALPCTPPMYRPLVPPTLDTQLQLQTQPSSESIDAAIGDVLTKPWLPLPLGLKPPSVDSVMGELQRQGVANVPSACG